MSASANNNFERWLANLPRDAFQTTQEAFDTNSEYLQEKEKNIKEVMLRGQLLYGQLHSIITLPRVTDLMNAIKDVIEAKINTIQDRDLRDRMLGYNQFWFDNEPPGMSAETNRRAQKGIIIIAVEQYKAMSGKADFDGMKNMAAGGGNCKRKPYPWNSRKVSRSPFRKLKTARNAYNRWSKKQPIGFTATSSLKSMGKIPRSSGCYELGAKYY
jgi:hypothetical protein